MFISSAMMGLNGPDQNKIVAMRERRTNSITGPSNNKSGANTSLAFQSPTDGNPSHGRIKQSLIL